jgi:hypothetical protein
MNELSNSLSVFFSPPLWVYGRMDIDIKATELRPDPRVSPYCNPFEVQITLGETDVKIPGASSQSQD